MKAVIWGDVIQMIVLFLGILICLGFGLNELGGIESFMSKIDKSRIDAIDFSKWDFQILMVMMPLDFGQWLLVEFFIRFLLWN